MAASAQNLNETKHNFNDYKKFIPLQLSEKM